MECWQAAHEQATRMHDWRAAARLPSPGKLGPHLPGQEEARLSQHTLCKRTARSERLPCSWPLDRYSPFSPGGCKAGPWAKKCRDALGDAV